VATSRYGLKVNSNYLPGKYMTACLLIMVLIKKKLVCVFHYKWVCTDDNTIDLSLSTIELAYKVQILINYLNNLTISVYCLSLNELLSIQERWMQCRTKNLKWRWFHFVSKYTHSIYFLHIKYVCWNDMQDLYRAFIQRLSDQKLLTKYSSIKYGSIVCN
jgi:hypothetical protein